MFFECFQITQRLGALEYAKGVWSAWDRDIFGILCSQLQKQPCVRATFMELAGGMQEARTVAQGGWYVQTILQHAADLL